jgi:hypothetical protein
MSVYVTSKDILWAYLSQVHMKAVTQTARRMAIPGVGRLPEFDELQVVTAGDHCSRAFRLQDPAWHRRPQNGWRIQ